MNTRPTGPATALAAILALAGCTVGGIDPTTGAGSFADLLRSRRVSLDRKAWDPEGRQTLSSRFRYDSSPETAVASEALGLATMALGARSGQGLADPGYEVDERAVGGRSRGSAPDWRGLAAPGLWRVEDMPEGSFCPTTPLAPVVPGEGGFGGSAGMGR